jgi:hypothetical protein
MDQAGPQGDTEDDADAPKPERGASLLSPESHTPPAASRWQHIHYFSTHPPCSPKLLPVIACASPAIVKGHVQSHPLTHPLLDHRFFQVVQQLCGLSLNARVTNMFIQTP